MNPLWNLVQALGQLLSSVVDLVTALFGVVLPWFPLVCWIAFWMLAVNWTRLRTTLGRGGWIGLVLIGLVAILIWGSVSPTVGGVDVMGLKVSNFVEKTVYVTGLACLMFLAGAVQLSGCCSSICQFDEPVAHDDGHGHHGNGHHGHDDHGHGHDDGHGSHSHDSHGAPAVVSAHH